MRAFTFTGMVAVPMLRSVWITMVLLLAVPSTRAADGSAWLREGQPTPQARQLLSILRHVDEFGLSREEFAAAADGIEAGLRAADEPRAAAALDTAALRLVRELHDGRVD